MRLSYSCCRLKVNSKGAINSIFNDKYGIRGDEKIESMPSLSIPLEWSRGPCGTKSYAITLIDYDAIPVLGFPFIHWTVVNIDYRVTSLLENSSRNNMNITEGLSSFAKDYIIKLSELKDFRVSNELAIGYGGFAPPDKPHLYTVKVYALNSKLNLEKGFYYNDMLKSMKGKILAYGTFEATYVNSN